MSGEFFVGFLEGFFLTLGCWLSALIGRRDSGRDLRWTIVWVLIISVVIGVVSSYVVGFVSRILELTAL